MKLIDNCSIKMQVRVLFLTLLLGLAGFVVAQEVPEQGNSWVWVTIGKVKVKAETVNTPDRIYLGLSHRRELPEGRGMLFLLPEMQIQTFCMRGMQFPLDFIWIADGRVAGLTRNVPATFPGDLPSPIPVKSVLEVPGGFVDRYHIKVGDNVSW